ncbi:MAG: DinB family protein [Dehalococcoidia bacterium]
MATPDELRAAIAEAREALAAALEAAKAGDWEKEPGTGEGEAAWSARATAEHVVGAEAFFTNAICTACGYPGVEFANRSYANAGEAAAALAEVIELTNKKLKYVSETDLVNKHERFGSVEGLMATQAGHAKDHAAQIRAAAGV